MLLMRSMTQREYLARLAWIEKDLGEPSRADYYAMQVAAEVRKANNKIKNPESVKLEDMKLRSQKVEKPRPVTRREAAARSRSRWFGVLGIKKDK